MIPPELLPDHPEHGDEITLPQDTAAGSILSLTIIGPEGAIIGYAENLEHVGNVAGHYILSNVTTSYPLDDNDTITLVAHTWDIKGVHFVNYYGWQASAWGNPKETLEEHFDVMDTIPIPVALMQKTRVTRYAALCLRKGEQNHDSTRTEKPTRDDAAAAGDAPETSDATATTTSSRETTED